MSIVHSQAIASSDSQMLLTDKLERRTMPLTGGLLMESAAVATVAGASLFIAGRRCPVRYTQIKTVYHHFGVAEDADT
jgi:hypothetical protein